MDGRGCNYDLLGTKLKKCSILYLVNHEYFLAQSTMLNSAILLKNNVSIAKFPRLLHFLKGRTLVINQRYQKSSAASRSINLLGKH